MRAALLCGLLLLGAPGFAQQHLRLSTTTSTENSGLLAVVLPPFEQRFQLKVDVIPVGSGKALKLAENGDVDVVLSHAPELERAFVDAGFGVNARALMYNDFVLVGPPQDPAHLRDVAGTLAAFRQLAVTQTPFISRGDESGTHQKEKEIWRTAGIAPSGAWYISAGQGMGAVLLMANDRQAYTLADRGTYLAYKRRDELTIIQEGDPLLFNPYTIIAVNPARYPAAKYAEAMELIGWLTSPEGQALIGGFTQDGQALFHPTAVPRPAASAGFSPAGKEMFLAQAFVAAAQLLLHLDARVVAAAVVSLKVSLAATVLAALFGVPIGFAVAMRRFRGRRAVETALNTLTALPTVLVGLLAYALLSRQGPLGTWGLLYSQPAMVLGETILVAPLLAALTMGVIGGADPRIEQTALTLGASRAAAALTVLAEMRWGVLVVIVAGFGRLISELGVALMVGGNIKDATRTMTTAIALETSKGDFAFGFALGLILLAVALAVNLGAAVFAPRHS